MKSNVSGTRRLSVAEMTADFATQKRCAKKKTANWEKNAQTTIQVMTIYTGY